MQATDRDVRAGGDAVVALLGLVRDAAREGAAEALAAHAAPGPSTTPMVDKRELARALAVSSATITRLVQEGAPHTFVGASPRFDVEAFRTWLASRGRKGTHAAAPKRELIAGVRLLSRVGR